MLDNEASETNMRQNKVNSYQPKSKEALKQIALDLVDNKVFTSNQIEKPCDIGGVFMPLSFLSKETIDQLQKDNICFFFEYYDQAGSQAINGMPMFFSCDMLNISDYDQMLAYADKIYEAKEKQDEFLSDFIWDFDKWVSYTRP